MRWWQTGVIYQIYPRSFMDANGDGIGDLTGISAQLDYIQWLGVDAIWLSPVFVSPMKDFGYDVADYEDIDPMFGTIHDFDDLLAEAHKRDLRVLLDYVPNHTSDQHPWFRESRTSRKSRKRDWYIWRDPGHGGGAPNNWLSAFGGSAWEWDLASGQYYLHTYAKEQPDLNWRNPHAAAAMIDVLRYWLDRGVDGFRIDALRQVMKDSELRDDLPNPKYTPDQLPRHQLLPIYSTDQPENIDLVRRFRQVADAYSERVLIGELWLPIDRLVAYYGVDGSGLHLPFNFHLISTPWNARAIASLIDEYESALPPNAWPSWVMGNHDLSRVATRLGQARARVAAMLLLTLRGTPTIYMGDEIGMHDGQVPAERVQDPVEKNLPGTGHGRDPERTPMQWNSSSNAGFSSATPWLPVAADYPTVNVAKERQDRQSMLALYCQLIALRRGRPALHRGSYRCLSSDEDLLVFQRAYDGERVNIVLNLSSIPRNLPGSVTRGRILLSTHLDASSGTPAGKGMLRPDEGLVVAID